jgi:hypothetical protein
VNTALDERKPRIGPDGWLFFNRASSPFVASPTAGTGTFNSAALLSNLETNNDESDLYASKDGQSLYFTSNRTGNYDLYVAPASSGGWVGIPRPVSGLVNSVYSEAAPVISRDNLTLYFASNRGPDDYDIYIARRSSSDASFGQAQLVTGPSSPYLDFPLELSADQCTLYFGSNRPNGQGGYDIWAARRP